MGFNWIEAQLNLPEASIWLSILDIDSGDDLLGLRILRMQFEDDF